MLAPSPHPATSINARKPGFVALAKSFKPSATMVRFSPVNFATAPPGLFYANLLVAMATDYVHVDKIGITYLDVPSEANGVPILRKQMEARGVQVVDASTTGLALVRQLADHSVALCSHGDVIPDVLVALADEDRLDLGPAPRQAKGSAWVLEAKRGRFVRATYISPGN